MFEKTEASNPILGRWIKKKELSEDNYHKLVEILSYDVYKHNNSQPPSAETLKLIAKSFADVFPGRISVEMLIRKTIPTAKSNTSDRASGGNRPVKRLGGSLFNKIQKIHRKKGKLGESSSKLVKTPNSTAHNQADSVSLKADINFLKSATLSQKDDIKDVLKRTFEYRRQHILDENSKIAGSLKFTFFILDSNLISYEFGLLFPGKEYKLVSQKNLLLQAIDNAYKIRDIFYEEEINKFTGSAEIRAYLKLLKMCQYKGKGKRSFVTAKANFYREFTRQMVSNYEIKKQYMHSAPFIIKLIDLANSDKDQFYVYLDGDMVALPPDSSFTDAVDLLIKIVWIFNINYDLQLKPFYSCIQQIAYNLNETLMNEAIDATTLVNTQLSILARDQ